MRFHLMLFTRWIYLFVLDKVGRTVGYLLSNSWSTCGPGNRSTLKQKTEQPLELKLQLKFLKILNYCHVII